MKSLLLPLLFLSAGLCMAFTVFNGSYFQVLLPAPKPKKIPASPLPALIKYWQNNDLSINWATLYADHQHRLYFMAKESKGDYSQLYWFDATVPHPDTRFRFGAALRTDIARQVLHVLTLDSATNSWLLWSRYQLAQSDSVVKRPLRLTDDYNAYFFDDFGQLPCLDKDGKRYYDNTAAGSTAQQGLPVVAGGNWEIRQLHPANKAGVALVGVGLKDSPSDDITHCLLYSCKLRRFVTDSTAPFQKAVFLTEQLLKVQYVSDGKWYFQSVNTAGFGQSAVGPYHTIISRISRDTTAAPALETEWEYAAIDDTGQLHLFDRRLQEYNKSRTPLPSHADKLWWLLDDQGFIVHDSSSAGVGWHMWKNGAPVGGRLDKAREMRPLVNGWFLCQSETDVTRYHIRHFNKVPLDNTRGMQLPSNLNSLVITHGKWPRDTLQEVVHLVWRDSTAHLSGHSQAFTYLLNSDLPKLKRQTEAERIMPYGRVLAILNDRILPDSKHLWRLYDCGRPEKELLGYYRLNWQPLALPGDPKGRYFVAQREAGRPNTQQLIRYTPSLHLKEYLPLP